MANTKQALSSGIKLLGSTLNEVFSYLHTSRHAKVPFVFFMHSADLVNCVFEYNFLYEKRSSFFVTPADIEAPIHLVEGCYHALAASFAGLVNGADIPHRDALAHFVFAVMRRPEDPLGQHRYAFQNAAQRPLFDTNEDWCNDVVGKLIRSYRSGEREKRYRSSVSIAEANSTARPRKKAKATGTPMFSAVYSKLDARQQQLLDRLTVGTKVVCLRPGKRFGSTMTVKSVTPHYSRYIDVMLTNGVINSDKVTFCAEEWTKDGTPLVQPITLARAAGGISTQVPLLANQQGVLGFEYGRSRYALAA